ncbi:unnamed protein product [Calypogeia fissa]
MILDEIIAANEHQMPARAFFHKRRFHILEPSSMSLLAVIGTRELPYEDFSVQVWTWKSSVSTILLKHFSSAG